MGTPIFVCILIGAKLFLLSQFWYTDETAERVADEVVRLCDEGKIACLACPSLFRKLEEKHPSAKPHLFEYDSRFEVYLKPSLLGKNALALYWCK